MQDSENKNPLDENQNLMSRRARRAAAESEINKPAEETEVSEEDEILGDEGDIPLRRSAKMSAAKSKGKKSRKKSSKKKGKIVNSVESLFSDRKFRRKKSIFEIMSATGEESFFKPLVIFGKEIRFWPVFLLVLLLIIIGMVFMSNNNVQSAVQQVTVIGLHEDLENYRIVVVSDLNSKRFGDKNTTLVRNIETLGYDMILCVGDMVGKSGDPEPFYEFLEGLSRPSRVYFVAGDADPGPLRETPREIQGTLEDIVLEDWILGGIKRGANYVDAPIKVDVGETQVWLTPTTFLNLDASVNRASWKVQMEQEQDGYLAGVAADYTSLPFTSYRYKLSQKFFSAQEAIQPTDFLIGLSHIVPGDEFIKSAALHDSDGTRYLFEPELIVSGHYCGGVWKLPFAGAFYVPNRMLPRYGWFPAKEDVEGLSKIGETQVFINPGLSTTSAVPLLPFRLNNEPTVTQLTLTAKLPDNMLDSLTQ